MLYVTNGVLFASTNVNYECVSFLVCVVVVPINVNVFSSRESASSPWKVDM